MGVEEKRNKACQILDALREIELLVAELYRRFARLFSEDRELWEGLSREEEGHAALAAELKSMMGTDVVSASLSKVHLAALDTYKKGLEYQLGRLERGEIGRKNALFIARDLEKTLVERMYYDLLRNDDPDSRTIRARIQSETGTHLDKLEKYIGKVTADLR
jgi:hypothetical protein